jgi:hypothetical protein
MMASLTLRVTNDGLADASSGHQFATGFTKIVAFCSAIGDDEEGIETCAM